jgi:hypothetical protein
LPDDQHHRLKSLATQRGMSLNKLIEELSISALASFDAENRFHLRAARGNVAAGLAVLDKAEAFFNNLRAVLKTLIFRSKKAKECLLSDLAIKTSIFVT